MGDRSSNTTMVRVYHGLTCTIGGFMKGGYGASASPGQILGAAAATMGVCLVVHKAVVSSGTQPKTMCAEWRAAETMRSMRKPLESNEEKFLMQNPIFSTTIDVETGRSTAKFGVFTGKTSTSVGPLRISQEDLD